MTLEQSMKNSKYEGNQAHSTNRNIVLKSRNLKNVANKK